MTKPSGSRLTQALYGTVPTALAMQPALVDLEAFEFAVLAALGAKARSIITDANSARARQAGKEAIEAERDDAEKFRDNWQRRKATAGGKQRAPVRCHTYEVGGHYKPSDSLPKALGKAGSAAYAASLKADRAKSTPGFVTVDIAKSALLKLSRLATDGRTLRRLSHCIADLETLTISETPFLVKRTRQVGDKLRLYVNGAWLDLPYARIPLPLPARSIIATRLWLFLQAIRNRTGATAQRGSNFVGLCERLGIDTTQPPSICNQAFNRGLDTLNKHLDVFEHRAAALLEAKIKVPSEYTVEELDNELVKLKAVPRQRRERNELAFEDEEELTVKRTRVRIATPGPSIVVQMQREERALEETARQESYVMQSLDRDELLSLHRQPKDRAPVKKSRERIEPL